MPGAGGLSLVFSPGPPREVGFRKFDCEKGVRWLCWVQAGPAARPSGFRLTIASSSLTWCGLEMANHPTGDDRDDKAHDRKPKTGSNFLPPKRITNRELWTPSIGHNGHIDAVRVQL
jgi:hypothetical protein